MANKGTTNDSPANANAEAGGGSSSDLENPWESAANDRLWNEGRPVAPATTTTDTNATTTSGLDPNWMSPNSTSNSNASGRRNSRSSGPPPSRCFQCFQACHWLDILMGSLLILYVTWWSKETTNPKGETAAEQHHMLELHRAWSIVLLLFATLWVLRGVLAKITPCGVEVSAKLSLGFAVLYGLWGLVSWSALHFANSTNLLLWFWPPFAWCRTHPAIFPCLLWALGLLEAIRFFWIRRWIHEEQAADASAQQARSNSSWLFENSSPTHHPNQTDSQPWWWRRSTTTASNTASGGGGRGEPLLSPNRRGRPHWSSGASTNYYMDDGISSNHHHSNYTSWWPFSRRRTDTARDDASVEYASLNEDWASRSEEDPFWWTQEDGPTANSS